MVCYEWGTGPEDSFPVQFVLLTRAQLRAAASVPRAIADSRKWLEQHLAEYQRQAKVMLEDFFTNTEQQQAEMKTIMENHAKLTDQAAEKIQAQLADAETVAKRIKSLMDSAVSEWNDIQGSTKDQCERLQQVSNELEDRFAWRVLLRSGAWFLLALGCGICFGHYWTR
jgi:hypothetical protein